MNIRPVQQPLIGKHVRVVNARNPTLLGKEGVVENETKNTLKIGSNTLIKAEITIDVEGTIINGELLTKQPSERIKVKK